MIGKRLGGRYEIQTRVGGGGMAIVYRGHDILLDRTVAIKVLRSQFGSDEDFIKRFRREAQAAAKISHPNVVNIYDVGEEEDIHYIVMEYVEGETLKDLINREAPLSAEKAVDIAIQITKALDIAHQHQIIHRDIKPHNILIGKNGNVKVTDFGIARAVTSATITHTGSVLGSVHYFSPEQAKGSLTGEKSDIYSLGVVLYEMVTGVLPFNGESPISVALKHLQEDIKDPKSINPNIPQSLENIILRALSKEPEQRYHSAREMLKDLETCLSISRANEAKFNPVAHEVDDNPTIIIPVKRMSRAPIKTETMDDELVEDYEEEASTSRRWVKLSIWLIVIVLIIGLGFYAVNKIQDALQVPDIEVPVVENHDWEEALQQLEDEGFTVEINRIYHSTVEEGNVIKQEPRAGTSVKKGAKVLLTVSLGKEKIPMPDVTSLLLREAEAKLTQFKEIEVVYETNENVPANQVIEQSPKVGFDVVPDETKVILTVSKGAETFAMPNLIGLNLEQVKAILLRYGLELDENIIDKESYYEVGTVIGQWPVQPGEPVSKGTKITIERSSGIKDDGQRVIENIPVILEGEQEVLVEIHVSDARYKDHILISERINTTKVYTVEVIVSPTSNATISLYIDGIETMTQSINFADVLGGD